VTLLGQPTAGSTVGYLFHTRNFSPASLNITAQAVPEPSTVALIAGFLCVTGWLRFVRRKSNSTMKKLLRIHGRRAI
jgi:hypothetical protein